ncbi:hypothetical protein GUITHDRAFT_132303 [Guillardia theta CCMP2712]|uniref:Uncharacterized protein n=1 Tax=Guillardia theta (strain CCMP2712) TaxID=905079 RepID=L1K2D2_GUITC|nr:hypothetical protein GUITHDRAFT_132303 [Guillardia theta CCMP2712]EKX54610.1 hypothetical protein GUITHDRAFT_132303 [Guillardia theta CCMP2712]|eukprot:XP_005841590.1 hypothetical protein GUITHDRAFT_132303 [Guillardia theta CCMP2712]
MAISTGSLLELLEEERKRIKEELVQRCKGGRSAPLTHGSACANDAQHRIEEGGRGICRVSAAGEQQDQHVNRVASASQDHIVYPLSKYLNDAMLSARGDRRPPASSLPRSRNKALLWAEKGYTGTRGIPVRVTGIGGGLQEGERRGPRDADHAASIPGRRSMMVRGLYSGCGLEEACEVKVYGAFAGGVVYSTSNDDLF